MTEQLHPIHRDEFIDYLEAKLIHAQEQLNYLEEIKQAVIDAETGGKLVRFYMDSETQTVRYEVKNKPPLGFNGT